MHASQKYRSELCTQFHLISKNLFQVGIVRAVHVIELHVFTFLVSCCDMPYDFSINTMSVRFFPLWVVEKAGVLIFCLCYLYLLRNADVERDFNIICCSCRLTVTRCVALVDQELLTIHVHPSFHSGFWWGSCCAIFSFLCSVWQIFVFPFAPFDLASALSVHH